MTLLGITLVLIGAFYVLGGIVVVRAFAMSRFLDGALERLGSQTPGRAAAVRVAWNVATALVSFAGGVSLMLLSSLAPYLFLASLGWQAAYVGWIGPRVLDPLDPPEDDGRRQAQNALFIYAAATAFVVWAEWQGALVPWSELPAVSAAAGAMSVAALAGYVGWIATRSPIDSPRPADDPAGDGSATDLAPPRRIKVMAEIDSQPLWVMDDGQHYDVAPADLALSPELSRALVAWADAYSKCFEGTDEGANMAKHRQHLADGWQLARWLSRERPELEVLALDVKTGVAVIVRAAEASPGA